MAAWRPLVSRRFRRRCWPTAAGFAWWAGCCCSTWGFARLTRQPAAEAVAAGRGLGLLGAYGSTVLLTLANPMTILSFTAVFAGFLGGRGGEFGAAAQLVAGVCPGVGAVVAAVERRRGLVRRPPGVGCRRGGSREHRPPRPTAALDQPPLRRHPDRLWRGDPVEPQAVGHGVTRDAMAHSGWRRRPATWGSAGMAAPAGISWIVCWYAPGAVVTPRRRWPTGSPVSTWPVAAGDYRP